MTFTAHTEMKEQFPIKSRQWMINGWIRKSVFNEKKHLPEDIWYKCQVKVFRYHKPNYYV